ncbi:hypothetical protein BD413DRAFT_671385, partial [Trametes elegans]
MDTTQHYSGLVHHPHTNQPHPTSDRVPPQSYPQDMAWQITQHSAPNSSVSGHAHVPPMMSHSEDRVQYHYAPPSAQQSFLPPHVQDSFPHHQPPSPSIDAGPSSNQMPFESAQISGSIGPDRGVNRRRLRQQGRVQSHGELPVPDYGAMPEARDHTQLFHLQNSRPHTPSVPGASEQFMHSRLQFNSPQDLFPPYPYTQTQSRSASGSAASAGSNPRSASPALSVSSALTSVSSASAPNSHARTAFTPVEPPPAPPRRQPGKKTRLWSVDRQRICLYAQDHPGMKQEDIAAHFKVERSTVSKILKHKARWLSVSADTTVHVAKM